MFNLVLDVHMIWSSWPSGLQREKTTTMSVFFFPLTKFQCLPADVDKEVKREIKTAKEAD